MHNDTTIHLGDFSMSEKPVQEILNQLNGKHILVAGNHDRCHPARWNAVEAAKERYVSYGFAEVHIEMIFEEFLLNHLPYLYKTDIGSSARFPDYRPINNNKILLHGHVHQHWKRKDNMLNVGVDVWNYFPVSIDEVRGFLK